MTVRAHALERLQTERLDLLIVGGGIIGAGVAEIAARHGLRVALIERDDFASGTSSASSKLIHGGLRYLRLGHFSLVREALAEVHALSRDVAPHLVRPLNFLLPVYRGGPYGRIPIRGALWSYAGLTGAVSERGRMIGPRRPRSSSRRCGWTGSAPPASTPTPRPMTRGSASRTCVVRRTGARSCSTVWSSWGSSAVPSPTFATRSPAQPSRCGRARS